MIAGNSPTLRIAQEYTARNWSVIPVPPGKKIPVLKGWQNLRLGIDDLPHHFQRNSNIGVLPGDPSGGLIDIDLDHPLAVELADQFLPATQSEFGRASKPRSHRLYLSTAAAETKKWKTPDDKMVVEFRSTGTQTVFPGSIHPEGEPIEWHSDGELAQIDPAELRSCCEALASEVFKRLGIVPRPENNGRRQMPQIRQPDADRGILAKRAAAYLATIGPAIEKSGGDTKTFHAACILVLGFELTVDEAWPIFLAWNETCQPPWDEKRLHRKLTEADKQPGPRGELRDADRPDPNWRAEIGANWPQAEGDELPDPRRPEGRTEAANAKRLVERHGQNLRWCDPWDKWLTWDGRRWAADDTCKAEEWAKDVADSIWAAAVEAAGDRDEKTLNELMRFAKASNSAMGTRNMLALARPNMAIVPAMFDLDTFALNVANGTLDLRTGTLRTHSRADYLTKLCPVEYQPRATCPVWIATLRRIMAGSQEMVNFLQRVAGYCLSGCVDEHAAFIAFGAGANGKSTFLGTFEEVLGPDYSMKAPSGLLMAKGNEHPTALADLQGKRFVSCIESDDGQRLAEGLVKELTGGDNIRARRMREDFWQFRPQHKIWLATNHKPRVRGTDPGIWRRIKLIPFKVSIPPEEQDKALPEKLRAELPGILAWMVQGFAEWQRIGVAEPAEVLHATAAYRSEQDVVGSFLASCCALSASHTVRSSDIYRAYSKWAEASGERVASQRRFGSELTDRGFERFTSNGTWYQGIGLLAEGTE